MSSIGTEGSWTYAAKNSQNAIQQLAAGATITDSFTAVSSDGSNSQIITVTIGGTNDTPVIGGSSTGAVTEYSSAEGAGNLSTGGTLTIADVDQGQSNFAIQANTPGN